MARPKIIINEETVYDLASINCSHEEMGLILDVSPDTLQRRFAAVIEKGRAEMKQSLKRKQYQTAMSGNVTMLIWLGKQHLGQSDKVDQSVTDRNQIAISDIPLPTEFSATALTGKPN